MRTPILGEVEHGGNGDFWGSKVEESSGSIKFSQTPLIHNGPPRAAGPPTEPGKGRRGGGKGEPSVE